MCVVVTEDSGEVHRVQSIVDYSFHWGAERRIEFTIEELEPVPDGPSFELVHHDTLARTDLAPGTQFELFFPNHPTGVFLAADVDGIIAMADGTLVSCAGTLRDEILAPREEHFFATFELTGGVVPLRCVSYRLDQ